MNQRKPLILTLDLGGRPIKWINWQNAANLVSRQQVAWSAGINDFTVYGGINKTSQARSAITFNSIIAIKGTRKYYRENFTPYLTNRELFRRDRHICLYCGQRFAVSMLTRDHIIPIGLGGTDTWRNVVTACRACNQRKACRTPEAASMPLLALPFAPSRVEYLILANRKILSDQMSFLLNHVPRKRNSLTQLPQSRVQLSS